MPTLTRAAVEREACNLYGRLMILVGQYGATYDGTNPSLNAPIRDALQRMGYPIADPAGLAVADADLAALDPGSLRRLLEWVGLLVLEQVDRDWWTIRLEQHPELQPRVESGVPIDPLARLYNRVVSMIARLREAVMTPYQPVNTPLSLGPIAVGTALDPSLPPGPLALIPPRYLAPDGYPGFGEYGPPYGPYWGCP